MFINAHFIYSLWHACMLETSLFISICSSELTTGSAGLGKNERKLLPKIIYLYAPSFLACLLRWGYHLSCPENETSQLAP